MSQTPWDRQGQAASREAGSPGRAARGCTALRHVPTPPTVSTACSQAEQLLHVSCVSSASHCPGGCGAPGSSPTGRGRGGREGKEAGHTPAKPAPFTSLAQQPQPRTSANTSPARTELHAPDPHPPAGAPRKCRGWQGHR